VVGICEWGSLTGNGAYPFADDLHILRGLLRLTVKRLADESAADTAIHQTTSLAIRFSQNLRICAEDEDSDARSFDERNQKMPCWKDSSNGKDALARVLDLRVTNAIRLQLGPESKKLGARLHAGVYNGLLRFLSMVPRKF